MHATVVLTVKLGNAVQQTTFYIAEVEEHGADPLQDSPLRPCINPFWLLQKVRRLHEKVKPNMMQRIIQLPCTHTIALPKEIKVQGSSRQTVTLDIPVLVNSGPLEFGETLVLE